MSSSSSNGKPRGSVAAAAAAELSQTLKEGERLLEPTRRPDGTLRKPIRIKAGYVPQDEVAIYQSKGALWKKEMSSSHNVPPGYDPDLAVKPKTKSVKRNERKKEKRLQAANDKAVCDGDVEELPADNASQGSETVESVASQLVELTISATQPSVTAPSDMVESGGSGPDIDKRIRALKKKIRLTEAHQQKTQPQDTKPEQSDKMRKLEEWQKELKLLEDKKAQMTVAARWAEAKGMEPPAALSIVRQKLSFASQKALADGFLLRND